MTQGSYDLVVIGGGLGGSALALTMAQHGKRVLMVERDEVFKDRIRGEGMTPWGTKEAQELGIFDLLREGCGLTLRYFDQYMGPMYQRRDLLETTPQKLPILSFYHPAMQEALLQAATQAGVVVRRGASITGIKPGAQPVATLLDGSNVADISARLIIGADGRSSRARSWAGFTTQQDPHRLYIGGVLLEGTSAPTDAVSLVQSFGRTSIFYPQRQGRMRAYFVYHRDIHDARLQGASDVPQFVQEAINAGTPAAWLSEARAVGPLATFEGADSWVDHPYRNGVALIGDAAACSDPSWGQGLSLTLRDVRTLRDKLLETDDWDAAGHAYAEEHDRYYQAVHCVEDWNTKLFMELGPEADARRAKALPLIMADPTRAPDVLISGPQKQLGEEDRARFFGD